MFSKELESVIEAALSDGVLTDKEREVLHKRALLEGIDPNELDVIIEGRLAKMKKEEDLLQLETPVDSSKYGDVKRCPQCGTPVEGFSGKCSACGYEFKNLDALKSSQKLAEKLEEINLEYRRSGKGNFLSTQNKINAELSSAIKNFPVPTTKEDILDFIIAMQSKWNTEEDYIIRGAYKSKYDECINKAKILFPNDPDFQGVFEQHQKDKKKITLSPPIIALIMFVLLVLLLLIGPPHH